MTNREAYEYLKQSLNSIHGRDESKAIAQRLMDEMFGMDSKRLIIDADSIFEEGSKMEAVLERLIGGEPLQYILGYEFFDGMKIGVCEDVLIPRPETEELVRLIDLKYEEIPLVVMDICTGSGCLAMSMRKRFPNAEIYGTDISESALKQAISNEIGVFGDNGIRFVKHDILTQEIDFTIPDLVVCNPPYIMASEASLMSETVLGNEPHLALFVDGNDPLLFYKKVVDAFPMESYPDIYFELNPLTADGLETYCKSKGLNVLLINDMSGNKRFALITT